MKLKLMALVIGALFMDQASAQTDISKTFGDYKVYYSVFNSSFITPEIAEIYGLTRAADQAIINISLIRTSPEGDSLGLSARISGQTRNLIMQSLPLRFIEIDEGDATYYLSDFFFEDQDPLHFTIEVSHEGIRVPYEVNFTRTLYHD
jgi:hypothetical protein